MKAGSAHVSYVPNIDAAAWWCPFKPPAATRRDCARCSVVTVLCYGQVAPRHAARHSATVFSGVRQSQVCAVVRMPYHCYMSHGAPQVAGHRHPDLRALASCLRRAYAANLVRCSASSPPLAYCAVRTRRARASASIICPTSMQASRCAPPCVAAVVTVGHRPASPHRYLSFLSPP